MVIVRDPVCGMVFVQEDAAGQTEYKGEVYYFCAPSCKKAFETEPEKYLASFNISAPSRERANNKGGKQNEKNNGIREHD